jgi:hypothetical protein
MRHELEAVSFDMVTARKVICEWLPRTANAFGSV